MTTNPIEVARGLIRRHGLRAGAVAEEHVAELRNGGEPSQLAYWQSVSGTVTRLRSKPRQDPPARRRVPDRVVD